jgi:HSP20 family protein
MLAQRVSEPQPLTRLRDEMDRLFEWFFGDYEPFRAWDPQSQRQFPALNIWQSDDNVFVEAELPGVTESDVEVTVSRNELTIKGQRPELEVKEGATVHRRERGFGAFSRVVHLPVDVDESAVNAEFHSGVLTITLPKAEAAKARHIPVRAPNQGAAPVRQKETTR